MDKEKITAANGALMKLGQKLWSNYRCEDLLSKAISKKERSFEVRVQEGDYTSFVDFAKNLGYICSCHDGDLKDIPNIGNKYSVRVVVLRF